MIEDTGGRVADLSRRRALALLGGATVGLAGCTGGDGGGAASPEDGDSPGGEPGPDGDSAERPTPAQPRPQPFIGGGLGYPRTVPLSEATYVVSDVEALRPTLEEEAESGDVVYVDPGVTLVPSDVSYDYADNIRVPAGVTLASDRGIRGAAGGRVHTDVASWPVFDLEEGARITGLRLSGPRGGDWDAYDEDKSDMGIRVIGPDAEVDNCELWGFGHGAVGKGNEGDWGTFPLHVHSCYVHHNSMDGLGYGVIGGLHAGAVDLIEYNLFENNRHSINGAGSGGYVARFNHVIGDAISHIFDMHRPGGTRIHVHNNTIEPVENAHEDKNVPGVTIRGEPEDGAWITHNWFHNPKEPLDRPRGRDWSASDQAITQMFVTEWTNVDFDSNHYGGDPPPSPGVGSPSTRETILDAMP